METRGRAYQVGSGLQGDAAGGLGVFELVDRGEMAIGERCIGQRPEVFGGLELGRIRRQEEQVDVLRDAHLNAGVPAGAIQDEDDLLGGASTDLARELGQLDREERDGDACRQMNDGAARGRVDKPDEVTPVVAVLDRRRGTPPVEAPDFLENGLQADAVLVSEVDRPALDACLRVRGRDCLDERPQLFLNAACCSGSASTWRGRGLRRLPSSRTR
jgi:hypothetical protein